MHLLQRLIFMACALGSATAHAAEEPAGQGKGVTAQTAPLLPAEDAALVKGLVVTGALTKVIGNFDTHGRPGVGDTFSLHLADLPTGKITFTRQPSEPSGPHPSYLPFSAPLIIERVRRQEPLTKPGRAAINLSARAATGEFLIQVQADRLEKGSKVRVLFYQGGNGGFIGSMAEAEGVLK